MGVVVVRMGVVVQKEQFAVVLYVKKVLLARVMGNCVPMVSLVVRVQRVVVEAVVIITFVVLRPAIVNVVCRPAAVEVHYIVALVLVVVVDRFVAVAPQLVTI